MILKIFFGIWLYIRTDVYIQEYQLDPKNVVVNINYFFPTYARYNITINTYTICII